MPELIFHSGGALTTVQDRGRFGYRAHGVPVSGVMDQRSFEQANWLVGNQGEEAVLELTFSGPVIEFTEPTYIALTGAEMTPLLNWRPIRMNETISIQAGDIIRFGELTEGLRTYLAISGGIDLPEIMGSQSTYLRGAFGGYKGRSLKSGDRVLYYLKKDGIEIRQLQRERVFPSGKIQTLRFIAGPESHQFDQASLSVFLSSPFEISHESDRMGMRLKGPKIHHIGSGDILSSPVLPGTVQISSDGAPIILMADAQTTGGYTRIAQIVSADISILAQMKPGDQVKFIEVSLSQD